ncbi:MAG: prepilin-type N-terminal cleavage/methylation domain-containing protein [Deltaproteobacteria bacterium]|nr:prepilin-type N-terminal cleavage/methylation domain-containing protein [Deltaproteobacteria bacterium]
MYRKSMKSNAGFTLIEVMVAMVVMAYGILAVMSMSVAAIRGNSTADHVTQVTILSDEVIEMIRANVDNISAYNGIDTSNVNTRPSIDATAGADYDTIVSRISDLGLPSGKCSIEIQNNTPTAGISTAQVTIAWSRTGNHSMTFTREFEGLH